MAFAGLDDLLKELFTGDAARWFDLLEIGLPAVGEREWFYQEIGTVSVDDAFTGNVRFTEFEAFGLHISS